MDRTTTVSKCSLEQAGALSMVTPIVVTNGLEQTLSLSASPLALLGFLGYGFLGFKGVQFHHFLVCVALG